jgi:Circadian oscillating protein COP23
MRIKNFIQGTLALVVIASAPVMGDIPAQAKSVIFSCHNNKNGTPTTFVRDKNTNGEERELIRWVSDDFISAGYTPPRRCREVTARIERIVGVSHAYITHGVLNNQSVICATGKGSRCTSDNLLYTLKKDQDGEETVKQLIQLNKRNYKNDPMYERSGSNNLSCRTYVSMDDLIKGVSRKAEVVCSSK